MAAVTSCVRVEQAAELMEEDMKRIESGEPSLIDLNRAAVSFQYMHVHTSHAAGDMTFHGHS